MHENGVRKQVELTHTKAGEGGDRVQRLSPRALQILEKAQARAGVDIDTIRYNSGHLHLETTLGYIRRAKNGKTVRGTVLPLRLYSGGRK